jgi:hypothetical protein
VTPVEILAVLEQMAASMRETSAGLRDGSINPHHAANRIDKWAQQINAKETKS